MQQLPRWKSEKKKKGPIFWTGPVLAGNRLWIANSEGQLETASLADGKVAPFTKLGAAVSLAPVVAGQMLYVLDDSGRISAFR